MQAVKTKVMIVGVMLCGAMLAICGLAAMAAEQKAATEDAATVQGAKEQPTTAPADYPPFEEKMDLVFYNGWIGHRFDAEGHMLERTRLPQNMTPYGQTYRLPNGNYLFAVCRGLAVETSPDGKTVVWKYETEKGRCCNWVERMANGNTLIIASGKQEMFKDEKGKDRARVVDAPRALEVSPDGKVVKETPLGDNIPLDTYGSYHVRCVHHLPNGNFLIAMQGAHAVKEFSPDGKLVWKYDELFKYRGPVGVFRCDNGNTLIGTSEGKGAGVFEVNPEGKVVWQLERKDVPDAQLQYVLQVKRLANGNTLVANAFWHDEKWNGLPLFEVTPEKKIVHALKRAEPKLSDPTKLEMQEKNRNIVWVMGK